MTMALKPQKALCTLIHWLYDRCERRLEKAVVKQDPFKTNQYLARQGILSDLLAYLESAMEANQRWYNRCWRTSQTYPAMKILLP